MEKKLVSIKFNEETLKSYKKFACNNDMTFSSLVKIALKEYVEKHGENIQNM